MDSLSLRPLIYSSPTRRSCYVLRFSHRIQLGITVNLLNHGGFVRFRDFSFMGRSRIYRKAPSFIMSVVASTKSREEEQELMMSDGKVQLNMRVDHQVEFGERLVLLGSSEEMGSWKKQIDMNWTENGWVSELELEGGDSIEFKLVIVRKDNTLAWESGDNRVLNLPKGGKFEIVCHWNTIDDAVDFQPLDLEGGGKEEGVVVKIDVARSVIEPLDAQTSPFTSQWQGKAASFMRSNEHGNRKAERKWNTSDLQDIALKLVESDQNSRNW